MSCQIETSPEICDEITIKFEGGFTFLASTKPKNKPPLFTVQPKAVMRECTKSIPPTLSDLV